VRYRRKKFTFAISSPDEYLFYRRVRCHQTAHALAESVHNF